MFLRLWKNQIQPKTDAAKVTNENKLPFVSYGWTEAPETGRPADKKYHRMDQWKDGNAKNTDVFAKNGEIASIGKTSQLANAKWSMEQANALNREVLSTNTRILLQRVE